MKSQGLLLGLFCTFANHVQNVRNSAISVISAKNPGAQPVLLAEKSRNDGFGRSILGRVLHFLLQSHPRDPQIPEIPAQKVTFKSGFENLILSYRAFGTLFHFCQNIQFSCLFGTPFSAPFSTFLPLFGHS